MPEQARRIFVGDIQGCLAQLDDLLRVIGFRRGIDTLHPVGDLVNKGPDSAGVVRRAMELGAEPVLGNHDLERLARGGLADRELRDWLAAQPVVRVLPDLIMVHGGLHPRWGVEDLAHLDEQQIEFATNVRYCDADGNRPPADWPPPGQPFEPWDHWYHGARRVVFGHWARRGLVHNDKVVGLDTGCVYGGPLTAWIAEEDRIVQVPGWTGRLGK